MNDDPNTLSTPGGDANVVPDRVEALTNAVDQLQAAIQRISETEVVRDTAVRIPCEEALREAQATLEERVRRRTAELTQLVVQLEKEMDERKRVEVALKMEEDLLRQMLAVQDRDRKLLAYEIHDGLAQQLTGALYMLQGFRERVATNPQEAWRSFDSGLHALAQGVGEVRRLIGGLRPPVLDESGVVAAVENLVYEAQSPGGPKIEFSADVRFDRLEPALENAIFRIVQECLTNACRYSKSERVSVRLSQRKGHVRIEVRDWGAGFDPGAVRGPHFGLQGIRERARFLSGHAVIRSAPGRGTHVLIELPLVETGSEKALPEDRPPPPRPA